MRDFYARFSYCLFFSSHGRYFFFLTRVMCGGAHETHRRFPARNERRDRFPPPISPRRTATGSAGVTMSSATWVVHPRLLFDSSHGGGLQGLPRADIARMHACRLRFPSESPGLRRLPALNGTLYDFRRAVLIGKVGPGTVESRKFARDLVVLGTKIYLE